MAAVCKLSPHEAEFIVSGAEENFRSDGRTCQDYRHFEVETGIVSNTSGSARLRLAKTDVLVGVKAEVGEPDPQRPNSGRLEFFVDCSANATPKFEGRGGESLSQEVASNLQRAFSNKSAVDLGSLCIIPGQQCWVLYVDALVLEYQGNLHDAVSVAIKAALHNTRIPNVTVSEDGGEKELEISDDPHDCSQLQTKNIPVNVTLNKVGRCHLVDATLEEEACSNGKLIVAVNGRGNICGVQKMGNGGFDPEMINEMLETAQKVGISLNKSLEEALNMEEETSRTKVGFLL